MVSIRKFHDRACLDRRGHIKTVPAISLNGGYYNDKSKHPREVGKWVSMPNRTETFGGLGNHAMAFMRSGGSLLIGIAESQEYIQT